MFQPRTWRTKSVTLRSTARLFRPCLSFIVMASASKDALTMHDGISILRAISVDISASRDDFGVSWQLLGSNAQATTKSEHIALRIGYLERLSYLSK